MILVRLVMIVSVSALVLVRPMPAVAKATVADYPRAMGVRERYQNRAPVEHFTFVDDGKVVEFALSVRLGCGPAASQPNTGRCTLTDFRCAAQQADGRRGRGGRGGGVPPDWKLLEDNKANRTRTASPSR